MSRLYFLSVTIAVFVYCDQNSSASWGKCWSRKKEGISEFGCFGVTEMADLQKAPTKVQKIRLHTSVLPNIEANVFYRFRNTLVSLDMYKSKIAVIDSLAFNGLTKLRNLNLWGNKLEWVPADWFANLTQLRTLDLSFNSISYIEESVFLLIPNLENLYIDYNHMVNLNWNVFTYLGNLRRVKLGKNPWDWWFRELIARQLDDQHVDYGSEWDDYDWINHAVWSCVEKHHAKNDDDSVLDCASVFLLEERSKIRENDGNVCGCDTRAQELYQCAMRSDPFQNVTVTPKIAVRKILQGFIACDNAVGLTIRMLNGKQVRLADISFSETIDNLKDRIAKELQSPKYHKSRVAGNEEWPPEKQKLWAYGCYLENGRTLSDYHLKSGDRIHLTLRIDD